MITFREITHTYSYTGALCNHINTLKHTHILSFSSPFPTGRLVSLRVVADSGGRGGTKGTSGPNTQLSRTRAPHFFIISLPTNVFPHSLAQFRDCFAKTPFK